MKNFSNAWKVLLAVVLLGAGFWTGRAGQASQSSPLPPLSQAGAQVAVPPMAVDGQGMYWSGDDLKKMYGGASPTMQQAHLAWTPEYRFTVVKRPYGTPETAGVEMHEDKTHIYYIISGTGTQILGGKPAKDNVGAEGQHNGVGPITGGTAYRVKPGDVLLVPPMTWHQTLPDEGQSIVYVMAHIETRHRIP